MSEQFPRLVDNSFSSEQTFMTLLFKNGSNGIVYRKDRPALLISSTSWTIDEDMTMLLESLSDLEARLSSTHQYPAQTNNEFPKLLVLVTGKGPGLRAFQQQLINTRSWNNVKILTMWFPNRSDYFKCLCVADLGLSFHQSSSGLDFPMKVVDMMSCGLPVLARDFTCCQERLKNGHDSYFFNTTNELTHLLVVRTCCCNVFYVLYPQFSLW